MSVTTLSASTSCGTIASVVVPRPSCPFWLRPKLYRSPPAVTFVRKMSRSQTSAQPLQPDMAQPLCVQRCGAPQPGAGATTAFCCTWQVCEKLQRRQHRFCAEPGRPAARCRDALCKTRIGRWPKGQWSKRQWSEGLTASVWVSPQAILTTRRPANAPMASGMNTSLQSPWPSRPKSPLQVPHLAPARENCESVALSFPGLACG